MKLIYYAPGYETHEKILHLLAEIKSKHDIDYEIVDLSGERGHADESKEKEVYKKDFLPRAKVLKARIGESVAKALRSRRGRGHFYIGGTIVVVRDEKIEWFPYYTDQLYDEWKRYDDDRPIPLGFLKMVSEKGRSILEKIVLDRPIEETEHEKLIHEFVKLNPFGGKFRREVEVGKGLIVTDKYGKEKVVGRKKIDLVCETAKGVWIIEVEPKLNATALGQAIVYRKLYRREHLGISLKSAIVCKDADDELYGICKEYVNEIFVLRE